jgi:signal transduction histidine kinase
VARKAPEVDATANLREEVVHLDIHPSVVFKLGEDLISDDVQAVMELIKNSWDADATTVKVTIDTSLISDSPGSSPGTGDLVGQIVVADNGNGMTYSDIVDGWLVVSNDKKKIFKREKKTTARKRTPLGDKGLGRLGVQRLGKIADIETTPRGGDETMSVEIPWDRFYAAAKLGDVSLTLSRQTAKPHPGTIITVRGLNEPDSFRGDQDRKRLQEEFAWLLSPYAGRRNYKVEIEIDGRPLELGGDAYDLRDLVQIHYQLEFMHERLEIMGCLRLDFFSTGRRGETEARETYAALMEADQGKAFASWFIENRSNYAQRWGLTEETDGPWYLSFTHVKELKDVDHVKYLPPEKPRTGDKTTNLRIADPGPFSGEVGAFSIDDEDLVPADNPLAFLKQIAGVHLYRDGFGIRMGEDWLGLGKRWTSGTSYYNLRPNNVLGHIDLTAANNSQLEEMTDREGLIASPYVDNFRAVMEEWRRFTEEVQGQLRRGYIDWRGSMAASGVVDPDQPGEQTAETLTNALTRRLRTRAQATAQIRKSAASTQGTLEKVARSLQNQPVELSRSTQRDLERIAQQLASLSAATQEIGEAARDDEALTKALRSQLERLDEQLALMHEAIGLGLSAEALTHEVAQATSRLIERSRQTQSQLRALGPVPPPMTRYLAEVRATGAALNRQLAHFVPALRFAREQREMISLAEFTRQFESYYNDLWASDAAGVRLRLDVKQDFSITMNRGRLTQVLDNLILNSYYWVRSVRNENGDLLRADLEELPADPDIHILVDSPRVQLWDAGPGVEPAYESILFEPFMTAKRNADGRGLGLYIVRRLLEPEHIKVSLLTKRNVLGRRYVFELNCSAAIKRAGR